MILVIDIIAIEKEECMGMTSISTESRLSLDDTEDSEPCSHNSLGIVTCE